jgi:Spy/CpxP family protein refolding chaperone
VNGNRGLIIAVAVSFIVGCSVGLMGGIVFTHLVGHGPGPGFGRGMEHRGPGGPGGPERRERMFTYMSRKMDLSPEQSKRIEALIDQARSQHEAVRESTEAALDRELTPEQRARWRELEKEMGMRRHGGREGPPPDRP